jgi:hypothetical protein
VIFEKIHPIGYLYFIVMVVDGNTWGVFYLPGQTPGSIFSIKGLYKLYYAYGFRHVFRITDAIKV